MRSTGRALAALAAAGAGAAVWGTLIERNLFTVRRQFVPVLATGAADVRVLHLSDLHMAPWQRRKQDWIRSLAGLRPDLIVNTGDNLGHARGVEGVEYALEPFRGVPGVFVHGSNDYHAPMPKNPFRYFMGPSKANRRVTKLDVGSLEELFTERMGWLDLNNAAGAIDVKGTHFEFFGVDDPHQRRDRLELLTGAIDEVREDDEFPEDSHGGEAPSISGSAATIAVTHAPYQRVLNSFVTHGADLIFAGHTHGGQVCVPGYGALVTNCDIPRRQVKGLSLWRHGMGSAYLTVSAGVGTSIYAPVRFACRPEATLITLTASGT